MTHPAIVELMRMMPKTGEPWPLDRRVVFFQAMDALLAYIYGGETHMIWLQDGEIRIAPRCGQSSPSGDKQPLKGNE